MKFAENLKKLELTLSSDHETISPSTFKESLLKFTNLKDINLKFNKDKSTDIKSDKELSNFCYYFISNQKINNLSLKDFFLDYSKDSLCDFLKTTKTLRILKLYDLMNLDQAFLKRIFTILKTSPIQNLHLKDSTEFPDFTLKFIKQTLLDNKKLKEITIEGNERLKQSLKNYVAEKQLNILIS